MIKKNNKGFTLLELLISIFILTIVIFLGYRVINKWTIDIKNKGNINQGQLTVNDMNEYLTRDLEQASNLVLIYDSKQLNNENLKNIFASYLQNKTDEPFIYIYKISKQNEEVEYTVEVVKDKNDYRYNVSRKETDGVSITFINNEIIKKDEISEEYSMNIEIELPFEISLDSPYKVSLGYSGKHNKFIRHEFNVASRLNYIGGDGSTNPDPDDDNVNSGGDGSTNPDPDDDNVNSGGDGSTNPNPDDSNQGNNNLDGDIVFNFNTMYDDSSKSNKTYTEYKSNIVGSPGEHSVANGLNNPDDLKIYIFGHENKMAFSIQGQEIVLNNSNFKNIIGMTFGVSGDIKLTNFKISFEPQNGSNKQEEIKIELDKEKNMYIFDFLKYLDYDDLKVTKLDCKVNIDDMKDNGETAQVKVDFIYKK